MRIADIRGPRRISTRLAREESGFALVELLAVIVILIVVLAALLGPLETAGSLTPKDVEYSNAVQEAGTGLQNMVKEVREAYNVVATTPNSVTFNAVLNGNDTLVMYACDQPYPNDPSNPYASSYHRCLRVSTSTGSSLPAISTGQVVIDRLLNGTSADPVFTWTPSPITPTYVEAQVKVPARGALSAGLNHTITLDNGAFLRNNAIGT
jgi:type II secretory pathway pseudopilin PulG